MNHSFTFTTVIGVWLEPSHVDHSGKTDDYDYILPKSIPIQWTISFDTDNGYLEVTVPEQSIVISYKKKLDTMELIEWETCEATIHLKEILTEFESTQSYSGLQVQPNYFDMDDNTLYF